MIEKTAKDDKHPADKLEQPLLSSTSQIRQFIASKVNQRQDVDDLLQETLFRTLRSADRERVNNPIAYAVQVAKTVVFEHWKRSKKNHENINDHDIVDHTCLESSQMNQGKLSALRDIIEEMPKLRREVFIRKRLEGKSREQIAKELGLSIDAVKKHIHRALVDIASGMKHRGWND